jgi:predicted regulator of Ras-like GTPase activity (Roadblock/LC7/MglB family)
MPLSNTKDIIPFVNGLENQLKTINESLVAWTQNKSQLLAALPQVDRNRVSSLTAIVKAEDALAEINTATFGVVAVKGQRLTTLLEDLKKQVVVIAENAQGAGIDPFLKDEITNAVSEVDGIVNDGLKLDYRIRQIQETAEKGISFSEREIVMPYKWESILAVTSNSVQIPVDPGVHFVDGDVTVLDAAGEKGILASNGSLIHAKFDSQGQITFDEAPNQAVKCYFPVKLKFADVPDDFLYHLIDTVVSKTSPLMEMLLKFEKIITDVTKDIEAMKGEEWTVDFSIMRNQKEIVTESITPKGLMVNLQDGVAHATFSYNDHPLLSHFVLEKWDEDKKDFVPFDGEYGVVPK